MLWFVMSLHDMNWAGLDLFNTIIRIKGLHKVVSQREVDLLFGLDCVLPLNHISSMKVLSELWIIPTTFWLISFRHPITWMTESLHTRKTLWILMKFYSAFNKMCTTLLVRDMNCFTCMWITDLGTENFHWSSLLNALWLLLLSCSDRFVSLIGFHRSWSSSLRGSASHWRSRRRFSSSSWTSWGRSSPPNSLQPMRR